MRYDFILFDADGTLFDFHKGEFEAVRETMEIMGITPSDELVLEYSAINDSLWKMLERKEITRPELLVRRFEIFCERFGFVVDIQKMARTYESHLSHKGYLFDGAEELCAKLAKTCSLYIVTNGVESIQKGRFSRLSLDRYFKQIFISGEIGCDKPDVRYFETVAERIPDFNKERAIIIGDSLTSDIKGGINYGIDTCWYAPNGNDAPKDMDITYVARNYDDIYRIITGEKI